MIKKLVFFSLLITCVTSAEIPFIEKPWYVQIKQWWDFFIGKSKNRDTIQKIKQEHNEDFTNILQEYKTFLPANELEDFLKERAAKKEYLDYILHFKDIYGRPIQYDQTIEKLSHDQISLFHSICNNYGINQYCISIIDQKLPKEYYAQITLKKDEHPMIFLNQDIKWETYSAEQLTEIFDKNIRYLVEGHLFDDQTVEILLDKAVDNIKNEISVKISPEPDNFFGKKKSLIKIQGTLEKFDEKIHKIINNESLLSLKLLAEKYCDLKIKTRQKINETYNNAKIYD